MTVTAEKETLGFETEVTQLLHLMVHALYSNKEIFLRELVSNASDAADKLRFEGLKDDTLFEGDSELRIKIAFDKEAKTVTISDNGVGMSRREVIQNLGTIAKSGTQEFLKALTGDEAQDRHLIGQFGVGFYSGFIVANRITVMTRRAGLSADQGVMWESKGEGDYSIENVDKETRGTDIILHLKDEEDEFLNGMRLRHIVTKYSDHISLPIYMDIEKADVVDEADSDKEKPVIDEDEATEEIVNKATALWTMSKSNIEEDAYKEFYKHIAHDFEDPLTWVHNKVEGKFEYTSLLYIPSRAPFDMWQPNKSRGLKLYVQRVFIMDEVEQFLPNYLRFVRGIIDSNDLPLNISREILQNSRVIESIRSAMVKRVLGLLDDLSKSDSDKYQQFWQEFGQALKEGPAEDFANKEAIAKLLRFATTHTDEEKQNVSFDDYIARLPEGQDKIYYVAADTFNAAKNSPHLEIFRQKGIEVFLLYDRIDEWLMSHLTEYQGKTIQSVAKGSLDDLEFSKSDSEDKVKEDKETFKQQEKDFESIIKQMQEALSDKVKEVRLSERLTLSPSCIVAGESDMTSQMERLLKSAGQSVDSKPILELNPNHILISRLKEEVNSEHFKDLSAVLLDQAILAEGGQLEDPATFVKKFNELLLAMAK